MHKRVFTFVLLFLLFFGLAIGNNLGSNPTTVFPTAALPTTDSMLQLLLNKNFNLEINKWVELTSNPLANLDFNQEIDKAIALSLLPDSLSDI
ncbi:hypothetical protein [Microseira wollei]|uniref:Uncharacterized protein n=1 Tax=Microseira wollei NIES-4236 TaxID=2530354 RepID=A0AAV3XE32_9CYAN|nr:hypothetical protein [Microseira wollei]GET41192.1 hypothetical protein MiSe_60040 [Microseira wollei NIES-4236]